VRSPPNYCPDEKNRKFRKRFQRAGQVAKACGVHSIPSLTGQRKGDRSGGPIHSYAVTQAVLHAGSRTKLTNLDGAAGSAACMLQFANDRIRIGGVVGECPANTHGVLLVPTSPVVWVRPVGCSGRRGDTPTLTFEAQSMREAQELCHEQWLKDDDLAEAKSDGAPLWDGKAKLRARLARPHERALFAEAKDNGQPSDGLMLVYLVKLEG
jgi:hypothetical protein